MSLFFKSNNLSLGYGNQLVINNLDLSHLLNNSKLIENKIFNKVDNLKSKLKLIDKNF